MDYRRFPVRIYYPEFFERAVSDYCNGENGADDLDVGGKAQLSVLDCYKMIVTRFTMNSRKSRVPSRKSTLHSSCGSSFSKTITDNGLWLCSTFPT
jgi:hypothetical protein